MEHPETTEEYINLLQRYLTIIPHLIPSTEERLTLSHPDLHLDNIFIDPETNAITSIIDWQSAAISPLSSQRAHPQMLELSPNPRTDVQKNQEKEVLDYYYRAAETAGLSRTASHDPYFSIRMNPITQISGCWKREDTFSLRQSLISVVAHWEHLYPDNTPCPIDFTPKELEDHERESELISGVAGIVQQLDEQGLIPIGGMVPSEDYDHARMVSEYFKKEFIDLAENEQKRELHANVWPY